MRQLYTFNVDGVWFSHNGQLAYQRGERPLFMWPPGTSVEPTAKHHITRDARNTRELLMFYRRATTPNEADHEVVTRWT